MPLQSRRVQMIVAKQEQVLRIGACAALTVGIAVSFFRFVTNEGFWEDEFYPIAFVNTSLVDLFVAVARLDQHPPLHFLQLKLWGLLFSSDEGLLANSFVWHLATCVVIFGAGRSWAGTTAGMLAAALYALVPQAVWASVTLRAYAMMPALAVAAWWLNIHALSATAAPARLWLAVAGVEVALGYTHAIAFFFVAWIALAAAWQAYVAKRMDAPWRPWLVTHACVAIALLPLPVWALAHGGGTGDIVAGNFAAYLGSLIAGWGMKSPTGLGLGAALYVVAVIAGLWNRATRPLTVAVLVVPFTLAMLVTMTARPMFKTPVYSAMTVPFLCLVLAARLSSLGAEWRLRAALPLLGAMALAIFPASQVLLKRSSPWQPVGAELVRQLRPGDVVVVPKEYAYWAVLRYAVGSDWGSPVEVLPLRPSENWQRVFDRLGPDLQAALHLLPKTDHVIRGGVIYVIGTDAVRDTRAARRVWIVHQQTYPAMVSLAEGFEDKGVVARYGDREPVELQLLERRAK